MKASRSLGVFLLGVLLLQGCGKKADAHKPVDQIQKEVQAMSKTDLEKEARAYGDAIMAKKADAEKVAEKVKSLSPTEMFSDKAKNIKNELSEIQSQLSALIERYQIYARKYQETGGDMNAIKIS